MVVSPVDAVVTSIDAAAAAAIVGVFVTSFDAAVAPVVAVVTPVAAAIPVDASEASRRAGASADSASVDDAAPVLLHDTSADEGSCYDLDSCSQSGADLKLLSPGALNVFARN
ncbi:hypothetical protein FHG87_001218 [Trinorchestia longiramus]|nr:hypothetical protein FHG87_001218 [Trinorchestia longiramus]